MVEGPKTEGADAELRRERTAALAQRAETTAERSRVAAARSTTARGRFQVAERRDHVAQTRDRAAEARDDAATTRDHATEGNGAAFATEIQRGAAEDREHSATDREHSAGDRWETRLDRDDLREALGEAQLDDLTGTYGRAMGEVSLRGEIDRAGRSGTTLVLAFVDVDLVPRRAGDAGPHATGDARLVDVVRTIRLNLRSYDLVVRFDEATFACGLSCTTMADARTRFEDIGGAIASGRAEASITVGLVELEPGDTLEAMIVRGDAARYDARHRH